MEDLEDEGEVVQIPAPLCLSTWEGPGRLVPIIDQMIMNFVEDMERDQRWINEEFAAGTLQGETQFPNMERMMGYWHIESLLSCK